MSNRAARIAGCCACALGLTIMLASGVSPTIALVLGMIGMGLVACIQ